uniref:Uncharacterized protein n=1 Tax=Human herpesvirus 2 TaxID=10310 RepID=A0A481TWT7_HHV2|nr:hypothetical protein [Human alphaherpesvirus 2]
MSAMNWLLRRPCFIMLWRSISHSPSYRGLAFEKRSQ